MSCLGANNGEQQHVNNVTYIRYAESSRVNWATNFAVNVDPAHRLAWADLMTPKSVGLIMKSIKSDFKFVRRASIPHPLLSPPRISLSSTTALALGTSS